MAKSFDSGVLRLHPIVAATFLAAVFDVPFRQTTHALEGIDLTVFTLRVEGLNGTKMDVRIREEGGKARILIDIFVEVPPI